MNPLTEEIRIWILSYAVHDRPHMVTNCEMKIRPDASIECGCGQVLTLKDHAKPVVVLDGRLILGFNCRPCRTAHIVNSGVDLPNPHLALVAGGKS